MNLAKVDSTGRIHAVAGLAALVASALPWYSTSYRGYGTAASASANAWDIGLGAWFPMVLLAGLGVLAVLPAFDVAVPVPVAAPVLGVLAGALAAVIVVFRWLSYPKVSGYEDAAIKAGASFGTYAGLALAVAVAGLSLRAHLAQGGAVADFTRIARGGRR